MALQDPVIKNRFGFLYGGYSFQYWETADMFRKLVLGGIPVFIAVQATGSMQAVLGQVVLVAYFGVTIWIRPFLDFWDNVISMGSMAGEMTTSMSPVSIVLSFVKPTLYMHFKLYCVCVW